MTDQLMSQLQEVLLKLPDDFDADAYIFSADSLPKLPESMTTNAIAVSKGEHYYGNHYRVGLLYVELSKTHAKLLALWILSALFHNQSLRLELKHPESIITELRVEFDYQQPQYWSGFTEQPIHYIYHPSWLTPNKNFPFPPNGDVRREILMSFYLIPHDDNNFHEQTDWHTKNVVQLCGSSVALVAFSELLLNFGFSQNTLSEFSLENETGYGGVANDSLEINFILK
jgi:hypothetical protein